MQVDFIYKKQTVGYGFFPQILPRTGDFFDFKGNIYRVEAVKFEFIPCSIPQNLNAKIYLVDVMDATEEKLRYT